MFICISILYHHVTLYYKQDTFHANVFLWLFLYIWKNYRIKANNKEIQAYL